MQGKRVRATIFDNDIDFFEDTFTVLKSYYISNVSIRLARPEYKFGDTKFQWFINNQSHVEEVTEEEGEDIKGNTYNFVPLSNISNSNSEAEIGKQILHSNIIFPLLHPCNKKMYLNFSH